jgi:Fe-S protein assembly co-chaperone HscB
MTVSLSELEKLRPTITAFSILAIEPTYLLDKEILERHYKILTQELHPDKFVSKLPVEGETAAQMMTWVNQAYKKLQNPVLRAAEVLQASGLNHGSNLENSNNSSISLRIFELQEVLEECKTKDQILSFKTRIEEEINHSSEEFQKALSQKNERELMVGYETLSYLHKILEKCQLILDQNVL